MFIIPTILLILGIILLLILIIPFHISVNLNKIGGTFKGTLEIKWSKIRLITKKFPEKNGGKKKEKGDEIEEEKEKEPKSPFSWKYLKKTVNLLIESRNYIFKFLKISWNSFHIEIVKIHIILGFESTVDTAITMGYMWSAASIMNIHPKIDFQAESDFTTERLDGNLSLRFNIRLLKPFAAFIWLLTKKPILSLLWNLRKLRK